MKHFQVHEDYTNERESVGFAGSKRVATPSGLSVALLTGGSDRPYVYGLSQALSSIGIAVDLIGSDELDEPDLRNMPGISFFNLRRDQLPNVGLFAKIFRILAYYWRLIRYAASSKPRIFHILWNNKFQTFDRTILMLYYRLLGKTVVLTAHNVNRSRRDASDTMFNRLTLRIQYRLADHIFMHTAKMKDELIKEFGVPANRTTVIPFGINNSVPDTNLSPREAKQRLGLSVSQKTILFFGWIKPYKGLEYLIRAFRRLAPRHNDYQLIITGRLEPGCERYWESIRAEIQEHIDAGRIITRIEFVPDRETEIYFKAADVLILPYRKIFQSGVLFLAYNFGLPVLAANVGSLKEDVVEGATGFVFRPEDPIDLARAIEQYFRSDLFAELEKRRREIRDAARQRHSWEVVAELTLGVYASLIRSESGRSNSVSRL
jgi:glycosyltransferase involved in cell wall biosynthesis